MSEQDVAVDVDDASAAEREFARAGAVAEVGVAVEDLVVSEHPLRAAYQNRFEHLRDPSHTRAFPLSGLLAAFTGAGLEVEAVQTWERVQVAERWLANAQTPPGPAAEVRRLLEVDRAADLSGARPFRRDPDGGCFRHRNAIVVGRKLRGAAAASPPPTAAAAPPSRRRGGLRETA